MTQLMLMNRPSRFLIAMHWAKREFRFVIDSGEPACFACGYYEEHWDRPDDVKQRWNGAQLERAHILAESIGGSPDVENFLLLCRQCHRDAPMTNTPNLLLNWARNRESWLSRSARECSLAIKRIGIAEEDLQNIRWHEISKDFKAHLLHRQFSIHPHSSDISGDTVALILKDFLEARRSGVSGS
jgi:hypothetical protein